MTVTGYGVIEFDRADIRLVDHGAIKPSSRKSIEKRIGEIYTQLGEVITRTAPGVMVLEELYSHYKHPVTAVLMGHVRGAACLLASERGIPVVGYSATMVKKAVTGKGHASKLQVQKMVRMLLGVRGELEPADVSDAVALAMTYVRHDGKDEEFR